MSAATTVGRSSSTRFIAPEGVGGLSWTAPPRRGMRVFVRPLLWPAAPRARRGYAVALRCRLRREAPSLDRRPAGASRDGVVLRGTSERCAQRDSSDRFNRDKERGGGAPLQTRASAPLQTRASAPSNPCQRPFKPVPAPLQTRGFMSRCGKHKSPVAFAGPGASLWLRRKLFRGERSATRAR
jgi:hypothetical protein